MNKKKKTTPTEIMRTRLEILQTAPPPAVTWTEKEKKK